MLCAEDVGKHTLGVCLKIGCEEDLEEFSLVPLSFQEELGLPVFVFAQQAYSG